MCNFYHVANNRLTVSRLELVSLLEGKAATRARAAVAVRSNERVRTESTVTSAKASSIR